MVLVTISPEPASVWTSLGAPLFHVLVFYHWSLEGEDQHLPLCCPPWGSCRLWQGPFSAFSSPCWTNWPQPFLVSLVLKAFHHLFHPSAFLCLPLDILLTVSCSSYTEVPKLHTVLKVGPHQCSVEWDNHPGLYWLIFNLLSTQIPRSLFMGLLSSLSSPNWYILPYPRCRIQNSLLLNFLSWFPLAMQHYQ